VTQINFTIFLEYYQEEDLEKTNQLRWQRWTPCNTETTTKKMGRIFLRNLQQRQW
jgi:hypothetical protein